VGEWVWKSGICPGNLVFIEERREADGRAAGEGYVEILYGSPV
jgi:hypothetical protein